MVQRLPGEILCYYKALGRTNSCTIGVQNPASAQRLQVSFNSSSYLQSGMAVPMSPAGWLQFARPSGFVPGGATQSVDLAFVPGTLATGVYRASLVMKTSDSLQPVFNLPVSLTIWNGQLLPLEQWRLTYFGSANALDNAANDADWDGDGLKNILEYAFNTNPPNANASPLTLTFPRKRSAPSDFTYLYEVASDLAAGTWNSGPADTTESVTDNLNGTEFVTVTLNATVSASPTRFARIRISQP